MSFLRKKSEHQWVEESLSVYIDGELSPREKRRVEEHLKECRACSESLTTLQQTVALLQELPTVPAPRSFVVRPAAVRPKAVTAPSAWGYGLLRGATALATLLLVLLIGADVALRFVGVTSLVSWAPAAPAPEVALAPSLEPSIETAPAEEEPMFSQTGGTEPALIPAPPENAQESSPPATAPAEAADALQEPQEMATAPARAEGAEPAGTPTAIPTPGAPPAGEAVGRGSGGTETCTAVPEAPAPAPTTAKSAEATVQPEPPPSASPEEEERRMAVVSPTATPEIMALAEVPERESDELRDSELPAEPLPLSPLRLAESIVLGVLLVLASATVFWTWLRRRGD